MKKTSLDTIKQLHQNGSLVEAERGYLDLLNDNTNDVEILHLLGLLYAEENRLDDAQLNLEKALALKPQDPAIALHLANIYKLKKQLDRAADVLQALIEVQPNLAAAYNNLGTIYYAQDKFSEAINAYKTAINIQADYVDAYYNLGLALSKSRRRQDALQVFESLLAFAPRHAGGLFQLGLIMMTLANYKMAIEYFANIVQVHPFHFESQTNLATCYVHLGWLDEAKKHYLQALNIMPEDTQILFNLGVISMQQGKVKDAIDYYERVLALQPDYFAAHNNVGSAYLVLKDNEAALQHFRAALRLQPTNAAVAHMIKIITHEANLSSSPPEYIRALFDSYADHYDSHLVQVLQYQVPQLLFQAVTTLRPNQQLAILDIGCGTGLCGEVFKPIAKTLVGVDLSANMLALAAAKDIYAELIESDIVSFLKRQSANYDLIVAGDVVVYFGDLSSLFAAAAQALRSAGMFAFNAEISAAGDYGMTDSGRFAQSKSYLERLAHEHGMTILHYAAATMRTQATESLRGHIVVVGKL